MTSLCTEQLPSTFVKPPLVIALGNTPYRNNELSVQVVTYLDVGNFCDKSTETTFHGICVQLFLRFSDSSKPSQSVSLFYKLAWLLESVNLRKAFQNFM